MIVNPVVDDYTKL